MTPCELCSKMAACNLGMLLPRKKCAFFPSQKKMITALIQKAPPLPFLHGHVIAPCKANFSHLHEDIICYVPEAISSYFEVSASNCLANREKAIAGEYDRKGAGGR